MHHTFRPFHFLIKNSIILAIAAYPITLILEFILNDSKPFTQYNHLITTISINYWDWILISIAVLLVTRNIDFRIKSNIDSIRTRHYKLEVERWQDTPYISPLHLYYLISPPNAVLEDPKSQALDPLYKVIISDFRDRVYCNVKYTHLEPNSKPTLLKVIGCSLVFNFILNITICICTLMTIYYLIPLNEWWKLLIPVVVSTLFQLSIIVKSVINANPLKSYKILEKYFEDIEPRISWRLVYPDQPYGESILFAWRSDCERRQRLSYIASEKVVPEIMEYKSPGLAPNPFPFDEIPDWAIDIEQYCQQEEKQRKHMLANKKKNNGSSVVLVFEKRKPNGRGR